MKRWCLISLLIIGSLKLSAGNEEIFRIVSYNVENFFDWEHDSLKNDWEFTPEGSYRWSKTRFYRKAEQIARVIVNIGGLYPAAIVGLCEVENKRCLEVLRRKLHIYPYQSLLFEGPDRRGIDVGMLYDTLQVSLVQAQTIRVFEDTVLATRDVIYASFAVFDRPDTVHVFMCHLPSQRGGAKESEWKRDKAKALIKHYTDSLLAFDPKAQIVVMGDMNTQPKEDLLPLSNQMMKYKKQEVGTHRYHGVWSCLDQAYLSPSLKSNTSVTIYDAEWLQEWDKKYLGLSPKRTFRGFKYNKNGFSDHLPIVIQIAW